MTGHGPGRSGHILVERADDVLWVTLNRPDKMNALGAAMVEDLLAVVAEAASAPIRLMVLQGAGKNFSAGFDMSTLEEESEGDLLLRFVRIEQLLQAVAHAPFETAAFAHGRNFGAGVDLVCACGRRFAAPEATFRMPGLKFGLVLGTRRFADAVGEASARSILWSAETFSAGRAVEIGFVEEVVEAADWPRTVERLAAAGRSLSPAAIDALRQRTRRDSRIEDLFHLVQSASQPGIKDRIRAYQQQR